MIYCFDLIFRGNCMTAHMSFCKETSTFCYTPVSTALEARFRNKMI